jgi:DnaJ like chaperone protein
MSIWTRIINAIEALATGESLSDVFDKLKAPPERSIAFTIAVIALGAKMAKADGYVTPGEVKAFRQVFHIPTGEENNAARVFNLARQDVTGYELYAKRISTMFGQGHQTLIDLLEGLFHIATADNDYHPNEDKFLTTVGSIFGLKDAQFKAIRARCVPNMEPDPYTILGVNLNDDFETIRGSWRDLIRTYHPDRMIARGLPEEAINLAERRIIQINKAFENVKKDFV